jgi:hypothetical protein
MFDHSAFYIKHSLSNKEILTGFQSYQGGCSDAALRYGSCIYFLFGELRKNISRLNPAVDKRPYVADAELLFECDYWCLHDTNSTDLLLDSSVVTRDIFENIWTKKFIGSKIISITSEPRSAKIKFSNDLYFILKEVEAEELLFSIMLAAGTIIDCYANNKNEVCHV